jgi:D-galactarolactone cycloisomerase
MVDSAIDFCNFDGSWPGAPTDWRRVAAMALSLDVRMCHHEEAHIGAHLFGSIPHGTFADTMHADVVNGHITLSCRPGLGWELDKDFILKHRVQYAD